MEKTKEISKNNKYFWFYPKSKKDIKLVLNINSKSESKKLLKEKFLNKKLVNLVLVKLNFKPRTSKLFPENTYVTVEFYNIENNKFYKLRQKLPGMVFFKNKFIENNGFKKNYLKKIVKKFYFDGLETKILNWKYYSQL